MSKETVFKAQGYLEKSYLDKDGAKHISFEFSSENALEIAKLELMGRDLVIHRPTLLEVMVRVVKQKEGLQGGSEKTPRQKHNIRRSTVDT